MDTKNVIAAISLSAAVIILYTLFFAPSPEELKKIQEENKSQITDTTEAPNLEVEEKITIYGQIYVGNRNMIALEMDAE